MVSPAFSGHSTFLASGGQAWHWTTKIALCQATDIIDRLTLFAGL